MPPVLEYSNGLYPQYAGCLDYVNKDDCVLNVPVGSLEAYKSADGWKRFKNIQEQRFGGGLQPFRAACLQRYGNYSRRSRPRYLHSPCLRPHVQSGVVICGFATGHEVIWLRGYGFRP